MTPLEKKEIEEMFINIQKVSAAEINNELGKLKGKIELGNSELNNKIGMSSIETHSKFEIIKIQLDSIEEQTRKTNGRVTKLEELNISYKDKIENELKSINVRVEVLKTNDIEHVLHCPNVSKIKAIEDSQLTSKSIYKFIGLLIGGLSTLTLIILTAIQIFIKK